MSDDAARVYIVDDDAAVRQAVQRLTQSAGLRSEGFETAAEFLSKAPSRPAAPSCLVLDVSLPGMSGIELQEQLAQADPQLPIIFVTGHGDIPMTAKAMRGGAVDFLEKPFLDDELLGAISRALARHGEILRDGTSREAVEVCRQRLTPRERQVMDLVVSGRPNKQTATILGVTEKTVKTHRARVMAKMEAESLADLVRKAGLLPASPPSPNP